MDSMSALSSIPACYQIGDTVTWTITLSDYDEDDDDSVSYSFAGGPPGGVITRFSVSGQGDGTDWTFTMPTGKPWGKYFWSLVGVKAGVKTTVASGYIQFEINPSVEPEESAAVAQLALAEAAMSAILANPMSSASINGESYTYKNLNELREMIVELKTIVLREQSAYRAALGLARDRNIQVTFIPRGGYYPRYNYGY